MSLLTKVAHALRRTGIDFHELWVKVGIGISLIYIIADLFVSVNHPRVLAAILIIILLMCSLIHRRVIRQMGELVWIDDLTRLFNRRAILRQLDKAISRAKRKKEQVLVTMMDLDHFKQVNDTLGHDAGDKLLVKVGKRLKAQFREQDTIGRLGGDEFMIICTGKDCEDIVEHVSSKIMDVFKEDFAQFSNFNVHASIGISIFPKHGKDGGVLMKKADVAMYIAKATGRNKYHLFCQSDEIKVIKGKER